MLELQLHCGVRASLPELVCCMDKPESKTEIWGTKSETQPAFFVSLCFLLFKSQTWQESFIVRQCFLFVLRIVFFFSRDELPGFVFPRHCFVLLSVACHNPVGCSCSALRDWANLERLWGHHCVFIRTSLCFRFCEISCQDVYYQFQMMLF